MEENEYLSALEAATMLGVSVRTFYKYVREGLVPAVAVGRKYRVPKALFQQWLEDRAMANMSSASK